MEDQEKYKNLPRLVENELAEVAILRKLERYHTARLEALLRLLGEEETE